MGVFSHPAVVGCASSPIGERPEEVADALLAGDHGIRGVEHAADGLGQSLVGLSKFLIRVIERVVARHAEKRIARVGQRPGLYPRRAARGGAGVRRWDCSMAPNIPTQQIGELCRGFGVCGVALQLLDVARDLTKCVLDYRAQDRWGQRDDAVRGAINQIDVMESDLRERRAATAVELDQGRSRHNALISDRWERTRMS